MTVAEALKQSKSRGFFHGKLIAYAQQQLTEQEDLLCAAMVMLTKTTLNSEKKLNYRTRMESSSKIKMLLCVTTRRMFFVNYLFGSALTYELPFSEGPKLDAAQSKKGIGAGGLKLFMPDAVYYISANRKLTNFLKSGIMAAFLIYQDRFAPKPEGKHQSDREQP